MTNQVPEKLSIKEIKKRQWQAISELRSMNRFFFGLIEYPNRAWIHMILLGLCAMSIDYYYVANSYSIEKKEFVESSHSWMVSIILWIQMFMVGLAFTRWRLVNIATGVELHFQDEGAIVHPDDIESRKAMLLAISFSRRFVITDMILGFLVFMQGILAQHLIVYLMFAAINL